MDIGPQKEIMPGDQALVRFSPALRGHIADARAIFRCLVAEFDHVCLCGGFSAAREMSTITTKTTKETITTAITTAAILPPIVFLGVCITSQLF